MRCNSHPNRDAFSFCFSCGNWYCNECLAKKIPQPICKKCVSSDISKGWPVLETVAIFKSIDARKTIQIASVGILIIWLVLGIFIHPLFYFFSLVSIISFSISFMLKKNRKKIRKKNTSSKNQITDAQVFALLNKYRKITSEKLAISTNSTEEASKKKLNQMVIDSILDIQTEGVVLVYTKKV